jgi:23S rRNA-/tRNA-specific pseudouridylate synthase
VQEPTFARFSPLTFLPINLLTNHQISIASVNELPPINILWDSDHAIAVDKPVGLSTQAPPGADSLESRLRTQLGKRGSYLTVVHRLDRPVSGIVLVALRKKEARLLSDQFASDKVTKRYAATLAGRLNPPAGDWIDWLRKIPDQPRGEVCSADALGAKRAETRFETTHHDPTTDRSTVTLFPRTGRMHQLRIQASHHGHPIVGDELYGGLTAETLHLRAVRIEFHDPRTGKRIFVDASPLP